MADGRDVPVWDNHAIECREANRKPFEIRDDPEHQTWLRAKLLSLEDVHRCLDVGCGPCYWINLFRGKQYNAVDQSPGMLNLAKDVIVDNGLRDRVGEIRMGNARSLPEVYQPGEFDLVFTSSVVQHNRHEPDKREIIEGIHTILKDGGYYLCTENTFRADNCPQSVGNPDYTDGYSFTPEGWEKYLKELGFELIEFNGKSEYLFRKV
jgi:SAM-dependent methyltransferase